jgi:uncharacterized protein (DUF1778 family)
MATRQARLELRLDERSKEHIVRAAELSNESVSSFVLLAAASAADKVLARAGHTVMPADQFDELLAALDLPDEAPVIARQSQRARKYRRV